MGKTFRLLVFLEFEGGSMYNLGEKLSSKAFNYNKRLT